MAHTDMRVHELVTQIKNGEIKLPEMQRQYVWSKTRVRDLLDSLYRGYPSGNILTWDHQGDPDSVTTRDFAIEQERDSAKFKLLLDGQQRLTSLSSILRGEPVKVRGLKNPIEILFNLEHPDDSEIVTEVQEQMDDNGDGEDGSQEEEEKVDETLLAQSEEDEETTDATDDDMMQRFEEMTFIVENQRLKGKPQWVRVSEIFKADDVADILSKLGHNDLSDPTTKKYLNRLKRVRSISDYMYRVDVLDADLSYPEVTEIFVRVNSLGVKLRSSDLALAQVTAKWPNSLDKFSEYREECALKKHFDFDLGVHMRNLVICATGQSRFNSVKNLDADVLQKNWDLAKNSMDFALDILGQNFSIESSTLLSSPFIALAVAQFAQRNGYRLNPEEKHLLRRWVMLANAKGRYARGSSESILDEDLRAIREHSGIDSLQVLIQLLDRQVGRLDFAPRDIEGRNRRSSVFKAMFLLFQHKGATDWHDGRQISTTFTGKQALQFHHIFPKKVLGSRYLTREVNDVCNLAFVSGATNRRIASDEPAKYLPDVKKEHGEDVLDRQCVPADPNLWSVDSYQDFLASRREIVAKELNEFILTDSLDLA